MWTTTINGFYSAVQHRDDPNLLVVRTRVKADAEHLEGWYSGWMDDLAIIDATALLGMPDPAIVTHPHSDYPWRVIVPRIAFGSFLAEQVEDLDYGNFKDAVKAQQGPERADVYGNVWAALLRLEALDPEGRPAFDAWDDDDAWAEYHGWETAQ